VFNFLMFLLWILSIVMMIVEFHWGWVVAFVLTTLYFIIRFAFDGDTMDILDGFNLFD
jgi:hypothetical protein